MELSVVIPTVRPRSEIEAIEYLDRCPFEDYEVIVRDDVPVTRARNEGYRRAAAEKILFLDDDSMPREGYLTEAAATLEDAAAVAGRTVHPRDDVFAGQLTNHYDFGPEPRTVDYFWGCNMGMRKEALDAVGGWDETMGWGHEEKELADRVRQRYDIWYNPEMVVDHVYAESIRDYWHKTYYLEKGTPYYLKQKGFPQTRILVRALADLFSPRNYVRRSPAVTLAKSGETIAGTLGRIAGLLDTDFGTEDAGPTRSSHSGE
ncbi:glycosyltransferase [Halovenus sp. WSH3]|uniref:Glycosyltransferase n=1 Tax=Halovenus carboxidivorans TaxID=2692199 RepID=A0A6B0TIE7_9EURY|nr:glycosyltransferase [Halovenus carboxidivorans]MXR52979.1 glycosyltransferase [Halovenus carboxidivorans]